MNSQNRPPRSKHPNRPSSPEASGRTDRRSDRSDRLDRSERSFNNKGKRPPHALAALDHGMLVSASRHAVETLLKHFPKQIFQILVKPSANRDIKLQPLLQLAQAKGILVMEKDPDDLEKLAGGVPHQGIIALSQQVQPQGLHALINVAKANPKALVLMLDGITDPHNLGAIIRTAVAIGVDAIVVPKTNTAPFNATTNRASAGLMPLAPLFEVPNLADAMIRLKEVGLWWAGADMGESGDKNKPHHSAFTFDWNQPLGLVMGAEGAGIRPRVLQQCDFTVAIPMAETVESLNVSVATAVMLFAAQQARA